MKGPKLIFSTVLILLFVLSIFCIGAAAEQEYGFSYPILIGGDDPLDRAHTTATHMSFFNHPSYSGGNSNFSPSFTIDKKAIGDVMAVPGAAVNKYDMDMILSLPGRPGGVLNSLNGIGPSGRSIFLSLDPKMSLTWSMDYQLNHGENDLARRFIIGDLRKTSSADEFQNFFGMPDQFQHGYIGNAGDTMAPYAGGLYPAAARGNEPFKWCTQNNNTGLYFGCSSEHTIGDPVSDAFVYDMIASEDGKLLIGASYDSFTMHISDAEYGISAEFVDNEGGQFVKNTDSFQVASNSPLTILAKDEDRFKLLGYTNLYDAFSSPLMEKYAQKIFGDSSIFDGLTPEEKDQMIDSLQNADISTMDLQQLKAFGMLMNLTALSSLNASVGYYEGTVNGLFSGMATSPWFPYASNPISVDMINYKGEEADAKAVAVTYQNTLFSWDDYFLNPYGRPHIFYNGFPYRMQDLIGFNEGDNFSHISDDYFFFNNMYPSRVVSPVIFWEQMKDFDPGTYKSSDPSNVFVPTLMALVDPGENPSPGIFHSAKLVDYEDNSAKRKEYIVVPSNKETGTPNRYKGMIYIIDPSDENRLHMKSWSKDLTNPDPQEMAFWGILGAPASEVVNELPMLTPKHAIEIPSAKDGYVPYDVVTGDLDGNECMDMVVTYRSAEMTVKEGDNNYGDFHVDFPNRFTVVLRRPYNGICGFSTLSYLRTLTRQIPAAEASISSVSIGDFIGHSEETPYLRNDIAVGNLTLEDDGAGKFTSFVYIFNNSPEDTQPWFHDQPAGPQYSLFTSQLFDPDTGIGVKRIRVGVETHPSKEAAFGTGFVTVEKSGVNTFDNLGVINGLPLMLPSVGCPKSADDPTTVISTHEGMLSVLYDRMSQGSDQEWGDIMGITQYATPFTQFGMPVPQRCAPRTEICQAEFEIISAANGKLSYFPLWQELDCPSSCKIATHLCNPGSVSGNQSPYPKPYVGYGSQACGMMTLKCLCELTGNALSDCSIVASLDSVSDDNTGFAKLQDKRDRFDYLTDDSAIANYDEMEKAYSYSPYSDQESQGNMAMYEEGLDLISMRYAPRTPIDYMLFNELAWTMYLDPEPSAKSASQPIAAGCSLIDTGDDAGKNVGTTESAAQRALPAGKASLLNPVRSQLDEVLRGIGIEPTLRDMTGGQTDSMQVSPSTLPPTMGDFTIESLDDFEVVAPGTGYQDIGAPFLSDPTAIRFPKGRPMPGPREMTALLGPPAPCGDGSVDEYLGEQCEPDLDDQCIGYGPEGTNFFCNGNCKCSFCGDNIPDAGEDCDDGGANGQPGHCRWNCTSPEFCVQNDSPDGPILDTSLGEECLQDSGCPEFNKCVGCVCQPPACKDGEIDGSFFCETDGECNSKHAVENGYECSDDCESCHNNCQDGFLVSGEVCQADTDCGIGEKCKLTGNQFDTPCGECVPSVCGNGDVVPGLEYDEDCEYKTVTDDEGEETIEIVKACNEDFVCTVTSVGPGGEMIEGCKCDPIPVVLDASSGDGQPTLAEEVPASSAEDNTQVDLFSEGTPSAARGTDCEVRCIYTSDNQRKMYEDLNETYFRQPTGRTDDFFCPMGNQISAKCLVKNAAKSEIEPWAVVQEGGLVLHDVGLITKDNYPLDIVTKSSPVLVAPLEAPSGMGMKPIILPDLSTSVGEYQVSSGISPMATTSLVERTSGIATYNNMVQTNVKRVISTSSPDESEGATLASSSDGGNSQIANDVLHDIKIRSYLEPMDPTRVSWPKVDGKPVDWKQFSVEKRAGSDPEYIRSLLESRVRDGKAPTRAIAYDLSDDPGMYKFMIVQNVHTDDGEMALQIPISMNVNPVSRGQGGAASCGQCAISQDYRFNFMASLPLILFIIAGSSTMLLVRVRVRKRQRRHR